jgi:hypothetical protein
MREEERYAGAILGAIEHLLDDVVVRIEIHGWLLEHRALAGRAS